MQGFSSYFKKRPHLFILGLILLIGLFFRSYQIVERFEFAHDGDLYSWIVKDIIIDHHPRLIGQLTSAPGIFIGPFFYYSLAPFFMIYQMNPLGVIMPITILGLLTILSYYFVLSRLFNKQIGLIAAFLYAILIATVNSDRFAVPTVATPIWSIWYFYTLVKISRRDYSALPILGLLIGFIWHIHIALIPALIAVPAAFVISKKIPTLKQLLLSGAAAIIPTLPLIVFEVRHNFQQTTAFMQNSITPQQGSTGFYKLTQVLTMIIQNTNALLFTPQTFHITQNVLFLVLMLTLPLFIIRTKIISLKDLTPLYCWFTGMILFFTLSSSPISEYYFSNLQAIFLSFTSLFLGYLFMKSKALSFFILALLAFLTIRNIYLFTNMDIYHKGYAEKENIVKMIKQDMEGHNYPCVGISYITALGENVGFRYLFYLNNIHLNHPSSKIPVYNIVIPDELSKEVDKKFGHIGIILPKGNFLKEDFRKNCTEENSNLIDTMLGFVK